MQRKTNICSRLFGFGIPKINQKINSVKSKIAAMRRKNISLFEDSHKSQLSAIAQSIMDLFEYAQKNSQLRIVHDDFIKDINGWLIGIDDPFYGKNTMLLPYLSECACVNSNNFNRLLNDRRVKMENAIMDFVKSRFSNPSAEKINYLSFGGGELLQDFIIVTKLMLAGYGVNINLVDSSHTKYRVKNADYSITRERYMKILSGEDKSHTKSEISIEKSNALKQFESLSYFAAEMKLDCPIKIFSDMDQFNGECKLPQDIVTAIDLDDFYRKAFDATMKAHRTLDAKGRMFLSVSDQDYIFANNKSLNQNNQSLPASDNINKFIEKLTLRKDQKILRAAILTVNDLMSLIQSFVVPYMSKHNECKEVILTVPHPQEVNYFGTPNGPDSPNLNLSKESLAYFISLFLPTSMKLTVNYIKGSKSLQEVLSQIEKNQDFVICYGVVNTQGNEALFSDIRAIHKHSTHADVFCGMQAYNKAGSINMPVMTFGCEWLWMAKNQSFEIVESSDEMSRSALKRIYNAKESVECKMESKLSKKTA